MVSPSIWPQKASGMGGLTPNGTFLAWEAAATVFTCSTLVFKTSIFLSTFFIYSMSSFTLG